jgi:nucleoid-associated protein YgaU
MLPRRWSVVFAKIMVVVAFIFLFSACAKQVGKTTVVEQPSDVKQEAIMEKKAEAEIQPVTEVKPSPEKMVLAQEKQVAAEKKGESEASLKKMPELRKQHIVRKGDSLWWIAKYKDHYNDPYLWPLIYKANKNLIKNSDIIYPGQKFTIPRTGFSMEDIKKARKKAGAPEPYLPPRHANLPIN